MEAKELARKEARVALTTAHKMLGKVTLATQAAAWNAWRDVVARAHEEGKAMKKLMGRILTLKEATA